MQFSSQMRPVRPIEFTALHSDETPPAPPYMSGSGYMWVESNTEPTTRHDGDLEHWECNLLLDITGYLQRRTDPLESAATRLQGRRWALQQILGRVLQAAAELPSISELRMLINVVGWKLTPRQREILECVDRGMRPKIIARALVISEQTVRTHIRDACRSLDASGAHAAVERARVLGILH